MYVEDFDKLVCLEEFKITDIKIEENILALNLEIKYKIGICPICLG